MVTPRSRKARSTCPGSPRACRREAADRAESCPRLARNAAAVSLGRGSRASENLAACSHGRGDVGDRGGGAGAGGSGVPVGQEHLVDAAAGCARERAGDVNAGGQAAGGHEQPPGVRGGADLLLVTGRDLGQRLARVMDGRDHARNVIGQQGKVSGRTDLLGRAAFQGPPGVGVGQPPGPQRQIR